MTRRMVWEEQSIASCGPLFDDYGLPQRSEHAPTALLGAYGGHEFWGIAPVDPLVAARYDADQAVCDFVWLIHDGHISWALVHVAEHRVIALDPKPLDVRTRAALMYRQDSPTPVGAP